MTMIRLKDCGSPHVSVVEVASLRILGWLKRTLRSRMTILRTDCGDKRKTVMLRFEYFLNEFQHVNVILVAPLKVYLRGTIFEQGPIKIPESGNYPQ